MQQMDQLLKLAGWVVVQPASELALLVVAEIVKAVVWSSLRRDEKSQRQRKRNNQASR